MPSAVGSTCKFVDNAPGGAGGFYVDTLGVRTTDFGLDDRKEADLVESGGRHAEEYFARSDDPAGAPVNRP